MNWPVKLIRNLNPVQMSFWETKYSREQNTIEVSVRMYTPVYKRERDRQRQMGRNWRKIDNAMTRGMEWEADKMESEKLVFLFLFSFDCSLFS